MEIVCVGVAGVDGDVGEWVMAGLAEAGSGSAVMRVEVYGK